MKLDELTERENIPEQSEERLSGEDLSEEAVDIDSEADNIASRILEILIDGFKAKEGRDPTEEEVEQLLEEMTEERIHQLMGEETLANEETADDGDIETLVQPTADVCERSGTSDPPTDSECITVTEKNIGSDSSTLAKRTEHPTESNCNQENRDTKQQRIENKDA